jgi:hypothetical protein
VFLQALHFSFIAIWQMAIKAIVSPKESFGKSLTQHQTYTN